MKDIGLGRCINSEIVFEVGGEGGNLTISRRICESGESFIYHHGEYDPTDEGFDIDESKEYKTFDEAFLRINSKYKWYMLILIVVNNNFRNYVTQKLIVKLNDDSVLPQHLEFTKRYLEETLNIQINYCVNDGQGKGLWRCKYRNY
jgi:hypothetical protein